MESKMGHRLFIALFAVITFFGIRSIMMASEKLPTTLFVLVIYIIWFWIYRKVINILSR